MSGWMTVALKEIREHGRDRRSLMSAALYSFMGPMVILLVAQSSAASKGGAPLLLSMMSVFALVSAFTGGMFLALDATAGERERGSLVPLLLNPIPSLQLVAGKWIAVAAFAIAGLTLNLVGFTAVFEWSRITPPSGTFEPWDVAAGHGNDGGVRRDLDLALRAEPAGHLDSGGAVRHDSRLRSSVALLLPRRIERA